MVKPISFQLLNGKLPMKSGSDMLDWFVIRIHDKYSREPILSGMKITSKQCNNCS